MAKMGVRRRGVEDPWTLEYMASGTLVLFDAGVGIATPLEWHDATLQSCSVDVWVYGTVRGKPDLSAGMIYVVFVIQGQVQLWCTTIDNVPLDTLVGSSTWGILGWLDDKGVHSWQQY